MPSGVVRYVGPDGRWGFISRDDKEPKVFLHLSEVEKVGFNEIRRGQRGVFDLV
ncbi:MAG: cold-shock protein [Sphingorhabdus sp.]